MTDRGILATVLFCIKQHGASAAYYAASRSDELMIEGAMAGAKTCQRNLAEIEWLLLLQPEGGARHRNERPRPFLSEA